LITGGCGFIGTNLVQDRIARGDRVRVLDNCSRPGVERNRAFLEREFPDALDLVDGDVRDSPLVERLAQEADVVFHLAAQVAVTMSVEDPRQDFEINALGSLNVLEAARKASHPPVVVYASTNKVYGALDELGVVAEGDRYTLPSLPLGVPESQPLDFHSPYGCSKGAADQYAIDYARIYALPTVVFRQSCIYGPWQYGNEDQGWIAHFLIRAIEGLPLTLYGDGRQVRDVLFVSDLLEAFDLAVARVDTVAGRAFNIGGGPGLTTSLLEFIRLMESQLDETVEVSHGPWRPGDQRVYVSDIRRATAELGWTPSTSLADGIGELHKWLSGQAS
jgi:CDP-paratose 2-epimerase